MHISISVTHGLAFKDVYKNSWRADGEKHKHAITETVAIHYIDLMRFTFGEVLKSQYAPLIVAKNGTAFDTSHVALQFRNGSASIFTSYAAPYTNRATVFGTDGVMEIIEDKLTIRAPRDTFSETGSFASPPVQIETALNSIDEYQQSLNESFCFFVEHAKVKKPLNPEGYKVSVETNRFLLELHTHNV